MSPAASSEPSAALWDPPAPSPAPVPCLHAINWECLGVTSPVTDPRPGRATCFGRSAFSDCDLAIAWERGGRVCLVCLCSLEKAVNLRRDSPSPSLGPELWLVSREHLCIYFVIQLGGSLSAEGSGCVCPEGAECGTVSLQSTGGRQRVVLSDPGGSWAFPYLRGGSWVSVNSCSFPGSPV